MVDPRIDGLLLPVGHLPDDRQRQVKNPRKPFSAATDAGSFQILTKQCPRWHSAQASSRGILVGEHLYVPNVINRRGSSSPSSAPPGYWRVFQPPINHRKLREQAAIIAVKTARKSLILLVFPNK
jgi:hypothetical protein